MAITSGQTASASDFVSSSSGASDSGKVCKLDSTGKISGTFLKAGFGGTGVDGALTISSGTTNIDLGGSQVFVKNYTSISITGTGALTFSNPHANGTIIILKSQGNVILTSSATRLIDLRLLGATGGNAFSGSGKGGRGGGCMYIECAGSWNFTGTVDASGENFVANTGTDALGNNGGGGGGTFVGLYNSLTANSGTVTVTAGTTGGSQGGNTGTGVGSNGTDSKGIYCILAGGLGGGNSTTTISTEFGIKPTISTFVSRYIPLICGSGGGGGDKYTISPSHGKVGAGLGSSGAGLSIIGANTEFV